MHRPLHVDVVGQGAPVVLVHGVGFGPWSMSAVADAIASDARVVVLHRAGYGGSHATPVARSISQQADDLLRTLNRIGVDRAVVAGFAGGATTAVAAAILRPERFSGLVLHEPAIGPQAPGVHALLAGLAGRVVSLSAGEALAEVVAAMLGPGAQPVLPDQALSDAHTIATEVPGFAAFAPAYEDLGCLRSIPVVTTLGAKSPPARSEAASVLAAAAGARIVTIAESAHLVQLDAPHAFAAEVITMVATT